MSPATPSPRRAAPSGKPAELSAKALQELNERVLRARLADARFFWDLDHKQKLESFLPKLNSFKITERLF